jgi:hypothetical protein
MLDDGIFELPLNQRIAQLRDQKPVFEAPKRPNFIHNRIAKNSTAKAIKEYAYDSLKYGEDMESFEKAYEVYTKAYQAAQPQCQAIEEQIIELINEDVGLTKLGLSEAKIKKLQRKAWDDASNEEEYIESLRELVELFED